MHCVRKGLQSTHQGKLKSCAEKINLFLTHKEKQDDKLQKWLCTQREEWTGGAQTDPQTSWFSYIWRCNHILSFLLFSSSIHKLKAANPRKSEKRYVRGGCGSSSESHRIRQALKESLCSSLNISRSAGKFHRTEQIRENTGRWLKSAVDFFDSTYSIFNHSCSFVLGVKPLFFQSVVDSKPASSALVVKSSVRIVVMSICQKLGR